MTALTERASADRRLLCLDGGYHCLRGRVVSVEMRAHSGNVIVIYVGGGIANPLVIFYLRPKRAGIGTS